MIQSLEGIDLVDRLHEMSTRIRQRVDNVKSEEATKTALVMPFINHVLGYNVFDPTEVVPEFVADVGTKKGEKVDYAIFRDGGCWRAIVSRARTRAMSGWPGGCR